MPGVSPIGCTAGDIRVNFAVADPRSLSFIAKAVGVQTAAGRAGVIDLVPYVAPNGFKVAIAHAGEPQTTLSAACAKPSHLNCAHYM